MKTYKKIFDINVLNKTFGIFIDDNGRYTFLEKVNEKYIYAELNDFLTLYKAFNNPNLLIVNEIQRYSFTEKVRKAIGGVLTVAIFLSSVKLSRDIFTEISEDYLKIYQEAKEGYVDIVGETSLDNALGYKKESITPEVIHTAIDNNEKLPDDYKLICHLLVNELKQRYPDVDLRIFYENVLDLEVNYMTLEEMQEEFKGYIGANFETGNRVINAPEDTQDSTKAHELSHTFVGICKEINGQEVTKFCYEGFELYEAMNNNIVNLIMPIDSYSKGNAIVEYFCNGVDYSIPEYISYGIKPLIDWTASKYPDIDMPYIIKSLDAMYETSIQFGVDVKFDANITFLDELFKICLNDAQAYDNPYTSFTNFAKLLKYANNQEIYYTYLDKYNEHLKTIGCTNIITSEKVREKYDELKVFGSFWLIDRKVCPCTNNEDFWDREVLIDGSMKNVKEINGVRFKQYAFQDSSYVLYSLPENFEDCESHEYWQKMALETKSLSKKDVEKVEVKLNGKVLTTDYLDNLRIQIGVSQDGNVAFVISNNLADIIYISSDNIKNLSEYTSLEYYISNFYLGEDIELSNYLNKAYLKHFLQSSDKFENVYLENDEIVVEPIYRAKILRSGFNENIILNNVRVYSNEPGKIICPTLSIEVESNVLDDTGMVTLKDIFKYYDMLNPEKAVYELEESALKDLVLKYIDDLKNERSR